MNRARVYLYAALLLSTAICDAFGNAQATEEAVDELTRSALELDAHPEQGAIQFSNHCARCHGRAAYGDASRTIPALAGQRYAYLVRQLANFTEMDRDSDAMHSALANKELRQPQTWADIASFLNRRHVARAAKNGDGVDLSLGEAIFREQCASCHRDDARGDDDGFVPSLRNQHYSYLLDQLNRLADGHRRNVDDDLLRFLAAFDPQEKRAVADYLSRLQGPGRSRAQMRSNGVVTN